MITTTTIREKLSFISMAILVISIFFVESIKALPTIGILCFLLAAWGRKDVFTVLKTNRQNKGYLMLIVIFFFYLGGVLSVQEALSYNYWQERFIVKIPYLLLPLALLTTKTFTRKQYFGLYYLFFGITLATAIGSIVNYLFHYDEINLLIRTSKALPVVVNHVRYSLFVCFSIFIAWKLDKEKFYLFSKHERWIYRTGGLFLVVFLHIAAVRSGLVAFYGMTSLVVLYQVILKDKRYKLGIGLLAVMIITPWLAFISLTSVQKKVENMKDDLGKIDIEERANNYSLTARWYSYKVGTTIYKEHLWTGIGIGNFEAAIKKEYNESYPVIKETGIKEPHNQYLYWLGSFGILGTLTLLTTFFFPLFYKKAFQNSVFLLLHYLVIGLSFIVENTIETQLGANYILVFCLIPFLYSHENTKRTS